jgi:hypothetical protein
MKKLFTKTFLLKILVIFLISFISRILINHYLGVNVFLDYANIISVLYYFGLFSFSAYFDQLFSFHLVTSTDIHYNVKSFNNDFKTTDLLFTKDHKNGSSSQSSTDYSSVHSKGSRKYVTTGRYIYLRPFPNRKGDMFLVPSLDFNKHSPNSISNIPPVPKPSNLSTPSTMSPLFNSDISNSSSRTSQNIINVPTNLKIDSDNSTMLADKRTNRVSHPRNLSYSSIRRNIIEDIQTKIKEAEALKEIELVKEAETIKEAKIIEETKVVKEIAREKVKKTPYNRIVSASK